MAISLDSVDIQLLAELQTDADRQILLLGFFGRGQYRPYTRSVYRHRLFHEDMLAGCNGGLEVLRTKARRRRQDHHLAIGFEDFLV